MQSLPTELWALIVDQLQPATPIFSRYASEERETRQLSERHSALYNLCLTSSRFRSVAQPVLYRILPPRGLYGTIQDTFLFTLERYPQLARHVEAVALSADILYYQNFPTHIGSYYAPGRAGPRSELVQACIHDLRNHPERDNIAADLTFFHWVALLPNLKLLEWATSGADPLFCSLLRRAAHPEPEAAATTSLTALAYTLLERVEEFCIKTAYYGMDGPVRLQAYQDVFWLPRLHTFRSCKAVLDITLAHKTPAPGSPHRRLSTLRHAHLDNTFATADDRADLLQACPSLQTLEVNMMGLIMGERRMDFGRLGEVLRAHGAALAVLELNFQETLEDEPEKATGCVGSLRYLPRLRHLRAHLAVLLKLVDGEGANGDPVAQDDRLGSPLPESLESLESLGLVNDGHGLRSVRAAVLGVLASRWLARLKFVRVWYDTNYGLTWDVEGWRCQGDKDYVDFVR